MLRHTGAPCVGQIFIIGIITYTPHVLKGQLRELKGPSQSFPQAKDIFLNSVAHASTYTSLCTESSPNTNYVCCVLLCSCQVCGGSEGRQS